MFKFFFPKLSGYLNKKQYQLALSKAKRLKIEKEFMETWEIMSNINSKKFEEQDFNLARSALYHAELLAKERKLEGSNLC